MVRPYGDSRAARSRIDVDPLEVPGGLGERIDALLGYLEPVGHADFLADGGMDVGRRAEVQGLGHRTDANWGWERS